MGEPVTAKFIVRFFALELLLVGCLQLIDKIPVWVYFASSFALFVGLWTWERWQNRPRAYWITQFSPWQFISLSEAAVMARDRAATTYFGKLTEKLSDGDALNWMVTNFAMPVPNEDKDFPGPLNLYGNPPGSSQLVLIPLTERRLGEIVEQGAKLVERWTNRSMYTNLMIERSQMKRRLRYHLQTKSPFQS